MVLLQWCQLTPQGPKDNIAAVIFTKAVQLSSIHIFPTGAKPFAKCPDIIASTEPDAFFLDVFFNALPIQPTNSAQKNLLVPTRIAYAGGQMQFAIDMGPEYATRLIIFQGQFKQVSMAIYGELVGDRPEIIDREPRPLPVPSPVPLSRSLDLAVSLNPTALAEQLLALMSSPAPLSLLIRLMFCLKPEKEDWDNPNFPYVYSNFDKALMDDDIENEVFDLESLVQSVSKPLKEDVSAESLTEFAGKMRDLLGSDPSDDAYYVAKLLTKSACQHTLFSGILLQHTDLLETFNEHTLDETTVLCLAEAAASIEISRYFLEDSSFMQNLENMLNNARTHKVVQKALKKLINRIYGWQSFERALENLGGDFTASSAFLKDISSDEFALGCWLECMISREDLSGKLTANAIPSVPQPALPTLFQDKPPTISHEEFIMFVRALLGVSTTLAMLAWSDSLGDDLCCERTLNALVVWQGADGYREILNHCLLLRQMARRLEWIKNDEDEMRPKKAGILVERLLVGLAKEPRAMLRSDVVTTVLALKPPFCYISTDEMLEMEKLARVAQDGLLSAFEEIAFDSLRPLSSRRLRVLRVAVAIIFEELASDNGEWHVLEAFWNDRSQRLVSRLITILVDISDDLNLHFAVDPVRWMNQSQSELLFRTGADFLHLILRFCKSYALTTRDLRALTAAIVDLYACLDAANATYSELSPANSAAISLRQICLNTLFDLSRPNVRAENDSPAVQVILRTLLEHASKSCGRDPFDHISQIYTLITGILPSDSHNDERVDSTYWATSVFPHIFQDLGDFFRLLGPETQPLFIERLVAIDNGEIGLGEWLLTEELKDLSKIIEKISNDHQLPDYRFLLQGRLSAGIRLWQSLLSSPVSSNWVITSLSSNSELSTLFNIWLSLLLDARLSSSMLPCLCRSLAAYRNDLGQDLTFTVLLLLLRSVQLDPSADANLDLVPEILNNLSTSVINAEALRTEIGHLLSAYSEQGPPLTADTSETLLRIMAWMSSQEDVKLTTLTGVSVDGFNYLCTTISSLLPLDRQEALSSFRLKLSIDGDDLLPLQSTELPETITLPLQSIENLFSSKQKEPSTPKGTKTPDILGVIISPPTAILRSPAATGLTKTYVNNDFRQLRQTVSTRLNTSRLPSTHVDEFESSPIDLLPAIEPISFQGLSGGL